MSEPLNPYYAALGKRLRGLRHADGLSLRDLDRASGGSLGRITMASYERGDRAVSPEKLAEVADWYGVSPGWLLTGRGDAADGIRIPAEAAS